MRKVPELRFACFDGEWEEKKIRTLGSVITGTTPKTSDASNYNGKYLFASPSDMYGQRYITNTDKTLSEQGFKKSRLLPKGSSLFVSIGATVGKMAQAPIDMATNQQINSVVSNNNYDQDYVFTLLNYNSDKIIKIVSTQTMPIINKTEFSNTKLVTSTNLVEQEKIGDLFKNIDYLIEIQEGKVAKMRDYKKSMVQKMFPKKDKLVPDFRFDGFDGEWKTVKFKEFLKEYKVKTKNENELVMLSSTNNGMTYRERNVSVATNAGYKIIYKNDLVLSPQNLWLGNINFNNLEDGIVSPSYYTFKINELEPNFIEPQIRTKRMLENYKNASSQGASVVRRNLEINEFYEIKLSIPSIEEQEKIGNFFKNLDGQIEAEEKLLESYKMMKKSLLQKMFV